MPIKDNQVSSAQLDIHAPLNVRGSSSAAQSAALLSQALGLGGNALALKAHTDNRENTNQAAGDFIAGVVDLDKQAESNAYRVAYDRAKIEADLTSRMPQLEQDALELAKQEDTTPEDLSKFIDGTLQGALVDEDGNHRFEAENAQFALSFLQQTRASLSPKVFKVMQEADDQRFIDNQITTYITTAQQGSPVDISGIIAAAPTKELRRQLTGTLVREAATFAIENGRPDLIEKGLFESVTLADGKTPVLTTNQRRELANSRVAAENRRSQLLASQVNAERAKAHSDVLRSVLENPHSQIDGYVSQLLSDGVLKPDAAQSLISFQRSQQSATEQGLVNNDRMIRLRSTILDVDYEGDVGDLQEMVLSAWRSGELGTGKAANTAVKDLFSEIERVKNYQAKNKENDKYYRSRDRLKSLLTLKDPKFDIDFSGRNRMEMEQIRAEAIYEFEERVHENPEEDPRVIGQDIWSNLQADWEARRTGSTLEDTKSTSGPARKAELEALNKRIEELTN